LEKSLFFSPAILRAEIAGLQQRVVELEQRPTLKYLGVWKEGQAYWPGNAVTDRGSVFICKANTLDRPGGSDAWQLAVQRGRDARNR
jgi:hypothetical protein